MRQKESRFAEQPAKEAHNACPHHIRYGDKRVEKTSPVRRHQEWQKAALKMAKKRHQE